MPKKILDILPPKEKKLTFSKKGIQSKIAWPKIFPGKKLLVLLFFFFILFLSLYFKTPKVKIKIWPKTEVITFQLKVQVDKDAQNLDFEKKILPAKVFEVEKTFSEEFPATGKVQKYAQGKIRLYNSFTTQEEVWREKTRFVSKEGKLFLSKNKIVVPGAKIKDGKIIPSFVDVEVIAAEPGPDYNIGPTTFSVVAFRGTPRYDKYYGESKEPMVGGGEAFQVKKSDLENAERLLEEKVRKEMEQTINNEIPSDFLFLPETLEIKILDKSPLAKEGQEVEKFLFQMKAKAMALAFKKENLENFLFEYIQQQVPEDQEVFKESLKMTRSLEKIEFPLSKAILSIDGSIQIYPKLDLLSLKKALAGKHLSEAKKFFEQQPEILRIEISPLPFWRKTIPKEEEKIEVEYPIID